MTIRSLFVILLVALGFAACSNDAPPAVQSEAELEAARLDSINQLLESSIKEVEQDATELKEALEDLDALFPEEEEK